MNQQYKVMWSVQASKDLEHIITHIANDRTTNALKVLKTIKDKASSLYQFPKRGRVVPELQAQGIMQYHEMIITPLRRVYRISEKEVYVLTDLDSRQNVEDILFQKIIAGDM